MQLMCDNQAAIAISSPEASSSHTRCKHIAVRHHFLRDAIAAGSFVVRWCPTSDQLADVCTKGLGTQAFTKLQQEIMQGNRGEK